MPKLTLSVDGEVIERAKRYAEKRGTSVSKLVQTFLDNVSAPPSTRDELSPITRRLYGALRGSRASKKDYLDYLARKYR
jgi:hypothetical protein